MSTDVPLVSIVVTTFNRLAYLRRALRSVEEQTFRDFELIVLDDGSSDGTREFLAGFDPPFAFSWEGFTSRERSLLRNAGAERSKGQLVAFLDDDDEWLPRKLERQVEASRRFPDAGMIYCFSTPIDAMSRPVERLGEIHRRQYLKQARGVHDFDSLARSCLLFTSTILVRRDVFLRLGGYAADLVGAEDWDLYLRMAKESSIHAVPEELVLYRVHEQSSAAKEGLGLSEVGRARIRAAERQLERLRSAGGLRAAHEALMLRAIALNHYWAGRPRDAVRAGVSAFRRSPATLLTGEDIAWLGKAAWKSLAARRT